MEAVLEFDATRLLHVVERYDVDRDVIAWMSLVEFSALLQENF